MDERFIVKRYPERGFYDREKLYEILDRNILCHISFFKDGMVYAIPMLYTRIGDYIYLHGSNESRLINYISSGNEVTISVTEITGIVIATKLENCSVNYYSVMISGKGKKVIDDSEKILFFKKFSNKIINGLWEYAKPPDKSEAQDCAIVKIKISNFSIKIREGGPKENKNDTRWQGVINIEKKFTYDGDKSILPKFIKDII